METQTKIGEIHITEHNKNNFNHIIECEAIIIDSGVGVEMPVLARSGYIYLWPGATLTAPVLARSGNIYLREGATLTCRSTKKLNYKSVDNTMFVTEQAKPSKGIKIMSGYIVKNIENGKINKEKCFVAEKENYSAHGKTIKKAVGDIHFKLMAEKIKNNPINKDTVITIQYYRTLTGACEFGCKSWMETNGIKKDEMKAVELLPLLEKTNAYGYDKFKSLITF
jgi:hypothetical protein